MSFIHGGVEHFTKNKSYKESNDNVENIGKYGNDCYQVNTKHFKRVKYNKKSFML